jgi:hypothetical protein
MWRLSLKSIRVASLPFNKLPIGETFDVPRIYEVTTGGCWIYSVSYGVVFVVV